MAELLVRVRDREGHNPLLHGEHEVVVICPDGWPWTPAERTSPDHRIVRLRAVDPADLRKWVQKEQGDEATHVRRRRNIKLVPESLSAADLAWYRDDSRKEPIRGIVPLQWDRASRARVPMVRRGLFGQRLG